MSDKRGRAQIGAEQEAIIAKYALDFPGINRTELAEKIQAEVKWPGKAPEIEVLERKISLYRNACDSPIDMPWTLDSLKEHPLPPEVLPKLFQIWLYKQESRSEHSLTIREARWIAQLSGMTEDIELLRVVANMCAEWELIGELTKTAQLSPPATMLFIYSMLTRMDEKELNEHHKEILRGKHVSGTRRGETIKGLGTIYGEGFLKDMKLKYKKGAKDNERTHNQEG